MKIGKKNFKYLMVFMGILFMPFYGNAQTVYANVDANYDGIDRVEIEGRFVDVNIIGMETNGVDLKGIIKGELRGKNRFKIKHSKVGSILKIWIEAPRSISGRFDAHITLKVPYNLDIDIRNSSGDVYIEEIVADKMKLKTSSGDVELKNIETHLISTSTSGDLEVYYLKGLIAAGSSSGDQNFKHVRANVSTRSTSGDISFSDVVGDLVSRTSSGDLQFKNIEGRISNISTSGDLTIEKAKSILNLATTSGDIEGNQVELIGDSKFKSTSGNVSIDFTNNMEEMSFDLRASSGDLKAGSSSADKKLYKKYGNVWIYGISSSGDQTYR